MWQLARGLLSSGKTQPPTSITLFMPHRSQTAPVQITVAFQRPQAGRPWNHQAALRPPPFMQPKRYLSHEKFRLNGIR